MQIQIQILILGVHPTRCGEETVLGGRVAIDEQEGKGQYMEREVIDFCTAATSFNSRLKQMNGMSKGKPLAVLLLFPLGSKQSEQRPGRHLTTRD